ncbi:MAG: hypothetical protein WA728_20465 [Xanthobacteraceae bacterium]
MANQATTILPHPPLGTFQPISAQAVFILARLAAKKAVKEKLRGEGRRLSLVFPAEITRLANEYLALHQTELFSEARERAVKMHLFDKPKRRRR